MYYAEPAYGKDSEYGHSFYFSGYLDSDGHYYYCEYCGKYKKEDHIGDPCVVCGHKSS